ncbi:MAG: alanyl-tRNA editing protein [Chloroflexi bacterium]|nr:alanyl-tRNA editing protein [Chloroflexota bacterium]
MTDILCYADSYLKEFDAVVTDATAKGVVLDRTAFYPGGGGQPADSGIISAGDDVFEVKKLSRSDGKLVHEIDGDLPAVGTKVHGVMDWERRYQLMRTHTALHILCGVVWRDYGAKVTGGNMQPGSARMDFELESMSSDFAERVEELVNAEVEAARDIVVGNVPREEAFQIPDLIRTKINLLPAGIKEVRTVDITGLDLQADGGTHVGNTTEVGRIRVVGHESKGRINKRLRIEIDL